MDSIAPITGAIIFTVVAVLALYRCYILPGYRADVEARHARDAR